MPSPIAHSAVALALHRISVDRASQARVRVFRSSRALLLIWLFVSFLPDFDAIIGLLASDLQRFHNNWTHSLIVGAIVALMVGGLFWLWRRHGFSEWFLVSIVGYELHVFMDFLTDGRGVMLLWPITAQRFQAPINLFYGLHYSDGLISGRHLITLATEGGFALLLVIMLYVIGRNKTPGTDREGSR